MAVMYSQDLPIGLEAPDFNLSDPSGSDWNLSKFAHFPGLLLIFTSNHCPYARAAWPLLTQLHEDFRDTVGFIAINSNDEVAYPQDSVQGMKQIIHQYELKFPYVRDKDQQIATAYQAQCTPDPFLFKNEGDGVYTLFYHGRINDNWQYPQHVNQHSLKDALTKLVADQDPPLNQKPSIGCPIKWIESAE